jgi:hypothetical protein
MLALNISQLQVAIKAYSPRATGPEPSRDDVETRPHPLPCANSHLSSTHRYQLFWLDSG